MDKATKNYSLVIGGGLLVLGAVAAYVTLFYTPGGPLYLLGTQRDAGVNLLAMINLAGGLFFIGTGVAVLLIRVRWSRVILLVISGFGVVLFGLGHLAPAVSYVSMAIYAVQPGGEWQVTLLHIAPHVFVSAGAFWLGYQVVQALFRDDSPYRIEPHELAAALAAIGVVIVALGSGFYVENAGWVSGTIPENQAEDIPSYQTIALQTSLPASEVSVTYAGSDKKPRAAVFRGDNFVLIQPAYLEPGRQVVVSASSAWRTFRFTFYTREAAANLLDLYLLAIHDMMQSAQNPSAPAYVALETEGMEGLDLHGRLVAARTLMPYAGTPLVHVKRLGSGYRSLSTVDSLYTEFDLSGTPITPGGVATGRDGIVIIPLLRELSPESATLEIVVLTGPDPNLAVEVAWKAVYRGSVKDHSWQVERIQ